MKSLQESIIKSVKAGKYALTEEWCKKFKPFNGFYKINEKNEIVRTKGDTLTLDFIEYDELPEYIQFASDPYLKVVIGGIYNLRYAKRNIKSLRGLPKKCHNISILNCYLRNLPKLEIETEYCFIRAEIDNIEGLYVNFYGACELWIKDDIGKTLDPLHIKGVKVIDFVNDFYFGDEFSKAIARKAPMNKYRNKYEFPVTEEGLNVINTFFGNNIDISDLEEIRYTQNSKLVKRNGMWYRCKNW